MPERKDGEWSGWMLRNGERWGLTCWLAGWLASEEVFEGVCVCVVIKRDALTPFTFTPSLPPYQSGVEEE